MNKKNDADSDGVLLSSDLAERELDVTSLLPVAKTAGPTVGATSSLMEIASDEELRNLDELLAKLTKETAQFSAPSAPAAQPPHGPIRATFSLRNKQKIFTFKGEVLDYNMSFQSITIKVATTPQAAMRVIVERHSTMARRSTVGYGIRLTDVRFQTVTLPNSKSAVLKTMGALLHKERGNRSAWMLTTANMNCSSQRSDGKVILEMLFNATTFF